MEGSRATFEEVQEVQQDVRQQLKELKAKLQERQEGVLVSEFYGESRTIGTWRDGKTGKIARA